MSQITTKPYVLVVHPLFLINSILSRNGVSGNFGAVHKRELSELVDKIRETPRASDVAEIRVPSERAFRERERRLREDRIEIGREVHRRLSSV